MSFDRASIARCINLFLSGVLIGAMFEEYLLLKIVLKDLSLESWVATHANFGLVHPYTIIPIAIGSTLALVLTLVWEKDLRSIRGKLTLVALAFVVAIAILTAFVMLPANDEIQAWASHGVPP